MKKKVYSSIWGQAQRLSLSKFCGWLQWLYDTSKSILLNRFGTLLIVAITFTFRPLILMSLEAFAKLSRAHTCEKPALALRKTTI